ncbi:DUF7507 domain-containing protein, partial [Serinibacter arcticus]
QADVDAGEVTNTATATGTPPPGTELPPVPPSDVTIPSDPTPALTVVKTSDTELITTAGQEITYTFVVTNTGNVTITDAAPVETQFSGTGQLGAMSPSSATLSPGEARTFTATYVVTSDDLRSSRLSNTAIATGVTPAGPPVSSDPSTVTTPTAPTAPPARPGLPVTGATVGGMAGAAALLLIGGAALAAANRRRARTSS